MKRIIIAGLFFLLTLPAFAQPLKHRYISLAPATTEILFALGLDDEIVGVSSFCNYPRQTKKKEKVGSFSQPNIEKIVALRPDIVFCTGLEQAPVIRQLRQLNIKVCVSDPESIDALFNSIREIGIHTNKEKEAQALIAAMRHDIEVITAKIKLIPDNAKQKVFVEIWYDPLMTAGKGSLLDELITLAGGINITHDAPRSYSYFSPEQVVYRNPDVIILTYMEKEKPAESIGYRVGWYKIAAVMNNRVYNDIDPDILLRPGPRTPMGLRELYKRLYPDNEKRVEK